MTTAYERNFEYSGNTLAQIRKHFKENELGDKILVVCGSYARREASKNSDIDFFLISGDTTEDASLIHTVGSAIREVVPHASGKNGPFKEMKTAPRCFEISGVKMTTTRSLPVAYCFFSKANGCSMKKGLEIFGERSSSTISGTK